MSAQPELMDVAMEGRPFAFSTVGVRAEARHGLRRIASICACLLVVLALIVLVGWAVGSEHLVSVLPGRASMKANTALCFLLSGVALLLAHRSTGLAHRNLQSLVQVLGVFVLLLGSLSFTEYVRGIDLHIDQFLFHDPSLSKFPGRMAPITCVGFCLGGCAIFLLGAGKSAHRMAQAAGLMMMTIALAGIVGFFFGVSLFYGSNGYWSMALHTGIGFLVLGCGVVFADPRSELARVLFAQESGGRVARLLLPFVIVVPILLGYLFLAPAVSFHEPRFSMALFAVTMVASGVTALWVVALFLNRVERQRAEMLLVRERSADAVEQSERELRLVTDHLPTLLSYIDAEGRFLRVNRTYELWLGLPAEQIVGRTIRELLGDPYWRRTLPARDEAMQGRTATIETSYPTVQGERQALVTYSPDLDEYGNVRGFACMVLDIDEHRRAEAALRQSEKLAVVGRLASSIAHEINNPLEAVTNLLYLAALETEGVEPAAGYVTQAQAELARVTHIVVQTLKFHRQSGQPTACNLPEIIEQVLSLYAARTIQANISIEMRFRQTPLLHAREGEMRQVIANLVGNAADAMAATPLDNGAPRRLLLRTRAATDDASGRAGVRITIADTGHGIPPAALHRLCEPFHTTKGEAGTGLGLWVSKGIIDRHLGTLRVRSSTRPGGSGTVFSIFLPHPIDAAGARPDQALRTGL